MKHRFEPTIGYPDSCSTCCAPEIMHIMMQPPQVYNHMHLLPMYCEPQVSVSDMQDAHVVLEHVLMFGARR
jgi:hypothetical protein